MTEVSDLYGASLTTTPLLLLAAMASTKVFGPLPSIRRTPRRRRRDRWHRFLDVAAVCFAAASFLVSLLVLAGALSDGSSTRTVVAVGLFFAALGPFLHVGVTVWKLYDGPETHDPTPGTAPSG